MLVSELWANGVPIRAVRLQQETLERISTTACGRLHLRDRFKSRVLSPDSPGAFWKSQRYWKMRERLANLGISVVSLVFTLLVLEVLLRCTHLFGACLSCSEPDEEIGYRFIPNCEYWHNRENDHPIRGRMNNYGWRDDEWTLEKPENTYRVAVLGDSFVEAFQVELERTFLTLAEDELNRTSSISFELMAFGRSGFTQSEELIVLQRDVLRFRPDMVMLFFFPGNDIAEVSREIAPNKSRPFFHVSEDGQLVLDTSFSDTSEYKMRSRINYIKQRSALVSLISNRYRTYQSNKREGKGKESGESSQPVSINGFLSLCTSDPDEAYSRGYDLNKILIKEIAGTCKSEGIEFVLVVMDNDAYLPVVEERYREIDSTFDPCFFEDDLRSYSEELSVGFIGLQSIFRKDYETHGKELHWGHWNYSGHELVARSLIDSLKAREPVSSGS